jgi:hypothetical protein
LKLASAVLMAAALVAACSSSSSSPGKDGGPAGSGGGSAGADAGPAGAGGSAGSGGSAGGGGSAGADAGSAGADGGSAGVDGGDAGGCPPFAMSGSLTCADTFDAQKTKQPPPSNPSVVTGACGGQLVWLNAGMLYILECVYDPTTKMLAGARLETDTGSNCQGAGATFPRACESAAAYMDGGAGG